MIQKLLNPLAVLGFILFVLVLAPLVGVNMLTPVFGTDVSGWIQAGIALISFPLILLELNQIRQTINRKPVLDVGLASIKDLPFSKLRTKDVFPTEISISDSYAHFYIVLINTGLAPAKHVKIYVEHANRLETQNNSIPPLVKVSEFSEGKHSFIKEHNFDFVFRAGTDWIINQNDIEPFGFHVISSIVEEIKNSGSDEIIIYRSPSPCTIKLDCRIWAEELTNPVLKTLTINIVESKLH